VQNYLVSQHSVPVYGIQIVGLGKDKPVTTKNRERPRKESARGSDHLQRGQRGQPSAESGSARKNKKKI